MYCPVCFSNTLQMSPSGVIHLMINNKEMDAGRFLYNTQKESSDKIKDKLFKKVEEFFKWYSSFQNKEPISKLFIYSSDFVCTKKCKMPIGTKFQVLDIMFDLEKIQPDLEELAYKYELELEIATNED